MAVGGADKASDTDLEVAWLELVQTHKARNTVMLGRRGYIVFIDTAGASDSVQIKALPVGGAPALYHNHSLW